MKAERIEFSALGHRCRAVRVPRTLERWLRRCWESEHEVSSARAHIEIGCGKTAARHAAPPDYDAQTSSLDGATLTWRRHGERWWSTGEDDAGVELGLPRDGARIRVWGARVTPPMLLALHVAMCEALRARGLVPLHAAVIVRDERATALVGRSGAGKSTTLLTAIAQGWSPLAEDFAWLDPATRQVHAWGGDRGVRLTDEGLRHVPARWHDAGWRAERDGKFFLGYDEMAVSRPQSAELTRVCVLHRDASRTSVLEPVTTSEAVRALWESAGVPLCRASRDAFARHVPALLSRLESVRLVVGRGRCAL